MITIDETDFVCLSMNNKRKIKYQVRYADRERICLIANDFNEEDRPFMITMHVKKYSAEKAKRLRKAILKNKKK